MALSSTFILTATIWLLYLCDSLLDAEKYVKIYSSCDPTPHSKIHKDNGLYYIKPSEYTPVIPVICSNGYTMIDGSLDYTLNSLPSYLSSHVYTRYSKHYIIPRLDDTATFRQWFLPSNKYTQFRTAQNCHSCEPSLDPKLTNNAVYYTDSSLFSDTNQNQNNQSNPCLRQMSADTIVMHTPQARVNHELIYKPVISMVRDSCNCYQLINGRNSNTTVIPTYFHVKISDLPKVTVSVHSNSVLKSVDYIDENIMFSNANDRETTHVLTIIFGLILVILFIIIVYSVYRLINHIFCHIARGNVKASEQTPLLGI